MTHSQTTVSSGQSHVVGVVLLLGITVVALGGLTATVGSIVGGQTAAADETRVSSAFVNQFRPVEHTGPDEARVRFSDGRLSTVQRQLRVLTPAGRQQTIELGGLVYESGQHRVAFVGGSVVRGQSESAWLERDPPLTVASDSDAIIIGAPRLSESGLSIAGSGGVTVRLQTNVSHERTTLGTDEYTIAFETATPRPLAAYFQQQGATTRIQDRDGDGIPSVVATFDGRRTAYLVVHDMRLEGMHG